MALEVPQGGLVIGNAIKSYALICIECSPRQSEVKENEWLFKMWSSRGSHVDEIVKRGGALLVITSLR